MPVSPERAQLYPDNWDEITTTLKEAAGYTCAACRVVASGREIGVHHFDDDPGNNEAWNLHVLCSTCHVTVTAGSRPGGDFDVFGPAIKPVFPNDRALWTPLMTWFQTALRVYRDRHPDGGRTRPIPLTPRRPPRQPRPLATQRSIDFPELDS